MSERLVTPLELEIAALGLPIVGHSSEGRPLHAVHLGKDAGPSLVVVGGVHGDEPSSTAAVVDLCRSLMARPPARSLWLWPALNPDGLARGTKNSTNDVDLNRNFPAKNFSAAHEPGYFPGVAPLCEPETRAFADWLEGVTVEGVVAVHAPFACVNYDGPAQEWAQEVAASCGWPARADIGYPTPGSLGSWLGVDRGWPVLTLELPGGAYENFRSPAQTALQTAINRRRNR